WPKYESTARRELFFGRVLAGVRALPGVQGAAYVTGLPMSMTGGIWQVTPQGGAPASSPGVPRMASVRYATPGLLGALGIPLVSGRDLRDADRLDQPPVAVVSASFARREWPGADPIGKTFAIGAAGERTVVGIAGDVRVRGLERPSEPQC